MTSDANIREAIATVTESYKAANDLVGRLSVAGELLGMPYPRQPSRMQKAIYFVSRVADWFSDIANKLPIIEAVNCVDGETLAAIDRFAVVRRIHPDAGIFAPALSATSYVIPSIMAAACTGNPLRRFSFDLVGESSRNLCKPDSLRLVANKLLHLEPGEKYSHADELKHYIELQWSEAESWGRNHLAIKSALTRELYESEGSSTNDRGPRSDEPSEKLIKQVREWKKGLKPKLNDDVRKLLHSKTYNELLPPKKQAKASYPSDRLIQIWCKKQSPTRQDGAN